MGFEFKLTFESIDAGVVENLLKATSFYTRYDEARSLYLYQSSCGEESAEQPIAWAGIERNSIYFCDNCGGSLAAIVFDSIRREGERAFGPAQIARFDET